MNKFLLVFLLVFLAPEDTVTVKRKLVEIREGTASYYPVVASASEGETLKVLEKKGRWLKVQTSGGASGWVFETSLESGGTFLESAVKGGADMSGTARSTSADSVAGAKGLDESKRYAASKGLDYRAVEKVENFKVSAEEVESFIRDGNLKPGGAQ
jgi:uncharacterized protein YgiM (DUF1202 family)